MAKVLVSEDSLTAIADAIRSKNSSATKYKPSEMATAINDITTGGSGTGDSGYSDNEMKALMNRSLTTFRFPEGITKIPDSFFQKCANLALTSLPEGITEIGNYCFSLCYNLTLNKLPDSLTTIGNHAFGWSGITISEVPVGVTVLDWGPFQYCEGITTFKLHAGIKELGYYALSDLENLTTVTFEGTPDSINSGAFKDDPSLTTINVPWAEGAVANAPWGATNATINYNYVGGDE